MDVLTSLSPRPARWAPMGEITQWMAGNLSPRARVLTALLPALVVTAYFVLGYIAYHLRVLIKGVPSQYDKDARGRSGLMGRHMRYYFFWLINPLWRLVLASGLSANAVTALAAAMGVGAAVAAGFGRFALAGWLFILSGTLDVFDGRLARARNQVSPAGAAIDSILDRYTDSLMLVGLAIYYRDSWVLVPVLFTLVGTSVVPYVRAKSEALGFAMQDGLMQRAERIMYLGGTVALSPILEAWLFPDVRRPVHWLAAAGIIFLCVTSNATGISRFVRLVQRIKAGHAGSPGVDGANKTSGDRDSKHQAA
jgi:phosphatidylglycerophosphate synthase